MISGLDAARGIPFLKGHGTENDFVILPDLTDSLDLTPSMVAAVCDRRAGIGGDGILRVVRTRETDSNGFFMDYRNADGSLAQMCGNGARVFGRYLVDSGLAPPGELVIGTRAGPRSLTVGAGGDVTVGMGPAIFPGPEGVTVTVEGRQFRAVSVDVGNPHAVAFVADLAEAGRLLDAPVVTPAEAFAQGVNVEFVVERGVRQVAMRVFERGVGETRSCGTGACAVFAAARSRAGAEEASVDEWIVDVPGGRLRLRQDAHGRIDMTGPAVVVAGGFIDRDWLESYR